MTKSQEFKRNADLCKDMAQQVPEGGPKKRRLERLATGWAELARNQAWLDGETSKAGPDIQQPVRKTT